MIRAQTCPICEKELPAEGRDLTLFPFCSQRCREVDLLRWCKGSYAIVEPLEKRPDLQEQVDADSYPEDAAG